MESEEIIRNRNTFQSFPSGQKVIVCASKLIRFQKAWSQNQNKQFRGRAEKEKGKTCSSQTGVPTDTQNPKINKISTISRIPIAYSISFSLPRLHPYPFSEIYLPGLELSRLCPFTSTQVSPLLLQFALTVFLTPSISIGA